MICGRCKSKIENGLNFCPICGARFKKKEEPPKEDPKPEIAAAAAPEETATAPVPAEPTKKAKKQPAETKTAAPAVPEQDEPAAKVETEAEVEADEAKEPTLTAATAPKAGRGFFATVSAYLRPASKTFIFLGMCVIALCILTAKVVLVKTADGGISGYLDCKIIGGVIAAILGLAGGAAAVLDLMVSLGVKDDRLLRMVKSILLIACAAAVVIVSLVTMVY